MKGPCSGDRAVLNWVLALVAHEMQYVFLWDSQSLIGSNKIFYFLLIFLNAP